MNLPPPPSSVSRRAFLATAALAGGARAWDNGVIRVGVIGCGGRGEAAAMNAMNAGKDIRIVAMGDVLMERVEEKRTNLRKRYPEQVAAADGCCFAGFDAYRHVIEASDAVIIANAARFHPVHVMAAVQAGKHVFVEKPHAIDPKGIRLLRAACQLAREKNVAVVSGLQSRYHPGYIETLARVADGAIGDVIAIQETWLRGPYVLHPRRPGIKEIVHQASNQYHFNWLSGDDVPQTLIHNLDRSSWALGNAAPTRAYGMGGRSTLRGEIYGNVFDHHSVVYDFPGGVRVYALCRTIDNCYGENSSLILGAKGRCDLLKLRISGETNWQHPGSTSKNNAYDLEHVALFNSIRQGKPVNNGDYMVRSTLITLMGQFSCYTGQEVTWDALTASEFGYPPQDAEITEASEPPVRPGPDGSYPVFTPGVTRLL